jgi:hypothetical protein
MKIKVKLNENGNPVLHCPYFEVEGMFPSTWLGDAKSTNVGSNVCISYCKHYNGNRGSYFHVPRPKEINCTTNKRKINLLRELEQL